jgi:tripeptide aminopeptidase
VDIAEKAMKQVNIKPIKPIRGGTDGCQLSYKDYHAQIFFAVDIIFMENTNMFQ